MKRNVPTSVVREIANHKCDLPIEGGDLVSYQISSGLCVGLRRKLFKFMTANSTHPDSKNVLKSTAQVQIEQVHHHNRYTFMIHPYSAARYYWEIVMIPVFLMLFILIPASISTPNPADIIVFLKFTSDCFCYIDVILWFFTGYYDTKNQTVVLKYGKVVRHYLLGFFLFDVVSSVPLSLIIYITKMKHLAGIHPFKLIWLLKIVRLPTLLRYLYRLSERVTFLGYHIKFINFALWMMVVVTWITSVTYMAIRILHPDPLDTRVIPGFPMLMSTFRVIRCLMNVGITEPVNSSKLAMCMEIFFIALGSTLEMLILAKVANILQKRSSSKNKYKSLLEEMNEYMKYKELPTRLKDKVLRYVEFKFQKHIFREEDILNTLSSVLRQDVLVHRCQKMVEKVNFFKDLPTQVLLRIVTKLRSEIFLPNDVIVLAGYAGHAMYFIYMGTVAVYTGNGKEICHLEDGSHFGEIALVINEPRVATVIAVKECEVFKLSRKDFQEAIEPFPELNKRIRKIAMSRLESTLRMMSEDNEERRMGIHSVTDPETDEITETLSI